MTSLVKQIDEQVGKNTEKKLCAFVVMLAEDADEMKPKLEQLAEKEKLHNVPLTIVEIAAGPPSYKIDKDAEVTVMMWKNSKVLSNHAFKAGSMQKEQVAGVMKDVPKLLED